MSNERNSRINNRVKELDLTKTFIIIISMIGIHTLYHLADYEVLEPSFFCKVLNIIATDWTAPVFMFCMGITLSFSRHQSPSEWLHRGIHLITSGLLLNVFRYAPMAYTAHVTGNPELLKGLAQIFNVDILQFAGLAFMLLAFCKYMKMSAMKIVALSIIMNVIGTLLIGHNTSYYVVNQILGYFYHTPTCSCFPLLGWFIFVAAGNLMGKLYRESDDVYKTFRIIIPICAVVAIFHQYFSITGRLPFFKTLISDWEYYNMTTPDALCVAFGVAPFMLSIFRLIGKLIPDNWMMVLSYPSRHINQFYCVSWVWIMWIHSFLYRIEPSVTIASFIVRWVLIVALTSVIVLFYNNLIAKRILPLFSSHEAAWTIGIWIILILFGILYFTNIQGPYIMPY